MEGMLLVDSVRRRERKVAFPFLERELETLYWVVQKLLKEILEFGFYIRAKILRKFASLKSCWNSVILNVMVRKSQCGQDTSFWDL
jgi:hypothetical protein